MIDNWPCPKDRHLWIIGHTGPVPDNGHSTAIDLPAGTVKRTYITHQQHSQCERRTEINLSKLYISQSQQWIFRVIIIAFYKLDTVSIYMSATLTHNHKHYYCMYMFPFAENLPACCGRTIVSFKPLNEIFLAAPGLGGTGCNWQKNNLWSFGIMCNFQFSKI